MIYREEMAAGTTVYRTLNAMLRKFDLQTRRKEAVQTNPHKPDRLNPVKAQFSQSQSMAPM